eukprot:TRINITY_DN62926_c0_g1_i1.p1 TRINITY_DN62926_c0_g1~~TRINITY_DN62926_c0_g1_i1.p1  ORF type:complete len:373 (-),score=76.13 TRINITY_DN62926_c0_g1_i1:175-1293(-)
MTRRSSSGTLALVAAGLLLMISTFQAQLDFTAPARGQKSVVPCSGGGRFAGRSDVKPPMSGLALASGEAPALSGKQAYFTGISWYLMHFIVSIGNDSIMKFLGESIPPFQVVFLRFSAAALVLLPILVTSGKDAFKSARLSMHAVRGALLALGIGLWCTGLNLMPFASCVVINNTMPFFKMLFAQLILGEKVGKQRWLASLAGFLGCLIVFNPTAATFQPKSLVLLLSACCFAMLDIFNKKYSTSETITSMLFYGSLSTAFIAAFKAIPGWVPVTSSQLGLIAVLGVGANFLLFCLLKAFKYVDASATCPYRYTEFVLAAIFGILFFAERPSASTLMGSCIILPSVIYTAMVETRLADEASPAADSTEAASA